jgi:heavy metal translocating P-type ATPase
MNKLQILKEFWIPSVVLAGIIVYLVLKLTGFSEVGVVVILLTIALGSYKLVWETFSELVKGNFVLDYIALVAIIVGLMTGEFLVAAIIALMIASGRNLEQYGFKRAKDALTKLVDRIPDEVTIWENNELGRKIKLSQVQINQLVVIRKGEVVGLDGELISENGLIDESSLTGEPYESEKFSGDQIRSGTINIGDLMVIKVTKTQADSTYNKIITMVKDAQTEKAPLVRLADKYSTIFTILTAILSIGTYIYTQDLYRVLAILVVATPCPLLLATPIALLGGVNAAAKKKIIVKRLASMEVLSRINALIFDKTGTITLGMPKVVSFELMKKSEERKKLIAIAESIERNSLHPLAKAIVRFAKSEKTPRVKAEKITEKIGQGIFGEVNGVAYHLSKLSSNEGMKIGLYKGQSELAVFTFEDEIKPESKKIINQFKGMGFKLFIFTGDKQAAADKVAAVLGEGIEIKAECTPADKQQGIKDLQQQKQLVAMVGDGINDAPALALADVGMVFSNEEQTAASEAADVVFLGGDFKHVSEVLSLSKRTIHIAMQSILVGMGLSLLAMVIASFGIIPPIIGAGIQEAIDVGVIINALRASRVSIA